MESDWEGKRGKTRKGNGVGLRGERGRTGEVRLEGLDWGGNGVGLGGNRVRLGGNGIGLGRNGVGLEGKTGSDWRRRRGRTGKGNGVRLGRETGSDWGGTRLDWGNQIGGVRQGRTEAFHVQKKIKHFSFKNYTKILVNLVNFFPSFNPPGEILILKWHLVNFFPGLTSFC